MREEFSHRDCGSDSDQSLEQYIEVRRAGQSSDCVLALLSVQKKDGSASHFEITGKQFRSFSRGVV